MNPQLHDEFVALAALFYSGDLTDEEWSLLQVHLAYCDSCRNTFEQYQHVASHLIPAMAASAAAEMDGLQRESESAIAEAEQRLMGKLGQMPGPRRQIATQRQSWRAIAGTLAACVLVSIVFASVRLVRQSSQAPAPLPQGVSAPSISGAGTAANEEMRRALERSRQQVTDLQQQIVAADERAAQTKSSDPAFQRQLDVDRVQQQQLASEKDALTQQLAAAQTDVQSLRDKATATAANAGQQSERTAELEVKLHTLNAALNEANMALDDKDRILSLDKDFLAHDKDIRDLMGARNLYIADIFDTNENGKTEKPFGRIFYTKDRSLVFYGFDLEKQAGLKQSVVFQAWGSGSDKQPTSLGLFYQDDSHKRWVLRCSDAKTLARMDMVFVTVEPLGGSTKPTGKQLLRAYLQIQPNHL